ncbi:MAG: NAD(P)/FAD-dependent oxidoreductase [Phaeodactylibacter sp.]|nr:NAD(P)/FAD-dependent oxidoreductase [Phaeodactylibacter sp.]MCB9053131.1 NAD(P)/FAD-dependent oxidoreductase [Lewinellaceae bacterium]
MKIGIIGAGVAGLASAVRMASRGHEVHVFESNSYPGGKLSEFELQGYRFDAGPSLFTMPQYVDDLYRAAGENPAHHFEYERLPVVCHYFWEDGTNLLAYAEKGRFAEEVEDKLGVPPERLHLALADSQRKYELTGRIFLEKSLHRLDTWLNGRVLRAMLAIPGLDLFTNMNAVNRRHLKEPRLVQLFNRFATYNGSNPYKAPGLLSIIPHFEHHIGAFFPRGGMYNITKSIYDLAVRKGVTFHFNTPVQEIIVREGRAEALRLDEREEPFERIISNMDVFFTYRKLLPRERHPERTLRQQKSTSALIFYWGIRRQFPELGLHNIFFSEDYRTEFRHLEEGKLFDDPTVYINITQKCEPGDAPEGCENWFTMINAPYDSGQDWDSLIRQSRKQILDKLSRMLQVDIEPLIECEEVLEPRTIESKTASHLGALYGTSSNNRMAAFLRHPNFSSRIKGLYFCGGSVHPGGGIPLALLSAKIVDEVMQAES